MALLDAPARRALHIYDVDVDCGTESDDVVTIQERPSRRDSRPLSILHFADVLFVAIAFGSSEERIKVADYPEDRYRNDDVIVPESLYQHFRGLKAWLRGEEMSAQREVESAFQMDTETGSRALMSAFLAIVAKDQQGFEATLERRLRAYRKQYAEAPTDAAGYVCLDALALCRLALERGLRVEEWPYIPVRLLPNYGSMR